MLAENFALKPFSAHNINAIWRNKIKMKATGIVRRIDDLGRVVIPKEIRRTMRIREGDPPQMTRTRCREQGADDFLMAMLEFGDRMYINE